jgi:regulator of sirC expression with transglutaminase-like and TPR domain
MPLASYLQAAHPRDILVRMLRNLKALFVEHMRWQRVLGVQQRLVLLLPDEITERRDRGLAFANLECPQAALHDLEAYLAERPHASDAESLRRRLPELRDACKRLN